MSAAAQEKTCHCGRPFGHTGRHIGFKNSAKPSGILAIAEVEMKALHATIARLKREISTKQSELQDAEIKLKPLRALIEAYDSKRITHEPQAQTQKPTASLEVISSPVVPLEHAQHNSNATDADFEPVLASFNEIAKWADARGLRFKSWDDLPNINKRREAFELPTFKRKFGLA